MTDTIREIVIKDFIARLGVISIANGYNTDIGKTVLRARKKIDPTECPCSDVFPGTEKPEKLYSKRQCTMIMHIEGIVELQETGSPAALENASVVSEMILGDLKKCILAPENELTSPVSGWSRSPDYISGINYTGGGANEYPDEGEKMAGAFADFEVVYFEKLNDPYAQ